MRSNDTIHCKIDKIMHLTLFTKSRRKCLAHLPRERGSAKPIWSQEAQSFTFGPKNGLKRLAFRVFSSLLL